MVYDGYFGLQLNQSFLFVHICHTVLSKSVFLLAYDGFSFESPFLSFSKVGLSQRCLPVGLFEKQHSFSVGMCTHEDPTQMKALSLNFKLI
jgi:hypothetical protein